MTTRPALEFSLAAIALSLVITSCRSAADPKRTAPQPSTPTTETAPVDGKIGFKVRLRWTVLAADEPMSKLAKLVTRNNSKEHDTMIDDSINPNLVDFGKVQALMQALATLPEDQKQELAKGIIYLGDDVLMVQTPSPARAESFRTLTAVKDAKVDGPLVKFELDMQIDVERARDLVDKSKAAIAALNERIVKLDAMPDKDAKTLAEWGEMRRARFTLTGVWRANARALARHADASTQAAADAEVADASAKASEYAVPLGRMPAADENDPL